MATKPSAAETRAKVAAACVDFGKTLLQTRVSSVTAGDARDAIRELFEWFEAHDAFTEGNAGIAIHAIAFGEQLLESRKTTTVNEATGAIQELYENLRE